MLMSIIRLNFPYLKKEKAAHNVPLFCSADDDQ